LSEDMRYLFSNDELDELQGNTTLSRMLVWDVIDLDDPVVVREYLGPNSAIDHNAYVKGNVLYQSNYQYGIRAINISDPVNPSERAFFDTSPGQSDTPGFGGSWTNYPFFDSGVVLVTSAREGLFILRLAN
jgi:choice-of-anchor B domain-containing protein